MTSRQHVFTRADVRDGRASIWLDDEHTDVIGIWPVGVTEVEATELWIETVQKGQST